MQINRRNFLKAAGASALLLSSFRTWAALSGGAPLPAIGLQTYTLGPLLTAEDADVPAVLQELARIGIKELETATGNGGLYYGYKPAEFKKMVDDTGMVWIGNHVGGLPRATAGSSQSSRRVSSRANLRDNMSEIMDGSVEGGCKWVVCASSAVSTLDEIKATAELFAAAGEQARNRGMKFAYHNHQSEFDEVSGTSAYEYVLNNTSSDEVFMEIDLAWAVSAGMDPLEMFRQYPKRFPLWHVKDVDKATGRPCPVGEGRVDFKRIFTGAEAAGLTHMFIEQDRANGTSDVQTSVSWMAKNIS